jgi:hypothetical protein
MKSWISLACTAVLAAGLVACGGGGGGSAPPAMAATVTINGSAATVSAGGQYAVKPGDTVEITPTQGANWTSSGSDASAITLRNPTVSGTKWTAQILNGTPNLVAYTVSATASANPALTQQTVLSVAAGDARNGQYRVYGTSGAQQLLTLDFNVNTYKLTNTDGTGAVSDDFTADSAEAGSFIFKSTRIASTVNTARFRMTTDAVVGGFPFVENFAATTSYAVTPFLGVRKFVTAAASLDGVYNRLGVAQTATTLTSQILQMSISGGGTLVTMCADNTIYSIANCPPASQSTYTITPSEPAGIWLLTNTTDPTDSGKFAIARIGDQNVYLSAGARPLVPGEIVWRLGVQDTPTWQPGTARGASTTGDWGKVDFTTTNYIRSAFNPDATTSSSTGPVGTMAPIAPAGMRILQDGAGHIFFGTYNTKLLTIVSQSNPGTAGYVQLSLID